MASADSPQDPPETSLWRELMCWVGLLVASRLLLLGLLMALTAGADPSAADTALHVEQAREPFRYLLGHASRGNMPPLLGSLLSVTLGPLLGVFSDGTALRLALIGWEAWIIALMVGLLRALSAFGASDRRRVLAAWILTPMAWMTSTIAGQDEVIATAWVVAALLFWSRGRWPWAALLAGLGVAAGKVFLVVLLAAMVALLPLREALRCGVVGGIPIVLSYGIATWTALQHGGAAPMSGFRPQILFGTTPWTLLDKWGLVGVDMARRASMIVVGFALATLLGDVVRRTWRGSPERSSPGATHLRNPTRALVSLWTAAIAVVWLGFYHVNPEYYLLALPGLLLLQRGARQHLRLAALLAVPWVVNVAYAVDHRVKAGRDDAITRIWPAFVPSDHVHSAALVMCAVVTAWLAVDAMRILRAELRGP